MIHTTWPRAPKHFETMEQAFDYCRECDRPVRVTIDGQPNICKLYPSGRLEDTGIKSN